MILIFDCETTGLDSKQHRIIEIAAGIYSDAFDFVSGESLLVYDDSIGDIPDFIQDLTKINPTDLLTKGITFEDGIAKIDQLISDHEPKCVLAHNAQFDRSMMEGEGARWKLSSPIYGLAWVCSKTNIKYPKTMKSLRLQHLALDHGIAVDPAKQHRALADVELLASLMRRAKADIDQMLKHATAKDIVVKALVKPPWEDSGASTSKAKEFGFRWEDPGFPQKKVPKSWVKTIKDFELEEDRAAFPYKIEVIL